MQTKSLIKRLKLKQTWPLHLMVIPALILLIIFCYLPMVGLVISFQHYIPTKGFFGSNWVGFDNYKYLFSIRDFKLILRNTVVISVGKIFGGMLFSVFFAVSLSELKSKFVQRSSQIMVFFPYFLSWVILGGIFIDILSVNGSINKILATLGLEPIFFLGNEKWFVVILIITDIWKGFGYTSIIYYSSILNIDKGLYEAATIDGASRMQRIFRITIPSILPIIMVMALLSLGGVLNAGFDQIFNMYNPLVYNTSDILDTYIYRVGIGTGQFSLATAMGLFKSLVGMILIAFSYYAADKFANYRII